MKWERNVTYRQTDGQIDGGSFQYLPSRAFGVVGDKNKGTLSSIFDYGLPENNLVFTWKLFFFLRYWSSKY